MTNPITRIAHSVFPNGFIVSTVKIDGFFYETMVFYGNKYGKEEVDTKRHRSEEAARECHAAMVKTWGPSGLPENPVTVARSMGLDVTVLT